MEEEHGTGNINEVYRHGVVLLVDIDLPQLDKTLQILREQMLLQHKKGVFLAFTIILYQQLCPFVPCNQETLTELDTWTQYGNQRVAQFDKVATEHKTTATALTEVVESLFASSPLLLYLRKVLIIAGEAHESFTNAFTRNTKDISKWKGTRPPWSATLLLYNSPTDVSQSESPFCCRFQSHAELSQQLERYLDSVRLPQVGEWQIANGVRIPIHYYWSIREAKPHPHRFVVDTQGQLREAVGTNEYRVTRSGQVVAKDETLHAYELGGTTVHLTHEEEHVNITETTVSLALVGFYPRENVTVEQILGSPLFIRPDITNSKGLALFQALHRQMTAMNKVAVCAKQYVSFGTLPHPLALVPQPEQRDALGQVQSFGFHAIPLAFHEENRQLPLPASVRRHYTSSVSNAFGDVFRQVMVSMATPKNFHIASLSSPHVTEHYNQLQEAILHRPCSVDKAYEVTEISDTMAQEVETLLRPLGDDRVKLEPLTLQKKSRITTKKSKTA
ncbi:hypothetical protein IWQ61_007565 [Dispira simplex]|nr:hypothetical protein IWQ61_007565 [Dispira simplex]